MSLRPGHQRQCKGSTNVQWKFNQYSIRPVKKIWRRSACCALEVTGEVYEDVVDQLALRVLSQHGASPRPRRRMVGIAGAPGSGKTTLAVAVADRINQLQGAAASEEEPSRVAAAAVAMVGARREESCSGAVSFAAVMPMDGFHYYRRELDAMPDPAEAHARRGAPWTFNAAKFVEAVRQVRLAGDGDLRRGASSSPASSSSGLDVGSPPELWLGALEVRLPSFDHGVGDPVENDIVLAAETRVVLVEGNYLLLDQEPWRQLRELFDETWFVSCPLDVVRQRLYNRQTGIGLPPEVSLERIRTNDLPNAELVAACAEAANVLVPGWVAPRSSNHHHHEQNQQKQQ